MLFAKRATFYPPSCNSVDGMHQETRQLRELEPLPDGRLVEDVEWLCVKSRKIGIKKRIGLDARW